MSKYILTDELLEKLAARYKKLTLNNTIACTFDDYVRSELRYQADGKRYLLEKISDRIVNQYKGGG